MNSLVPKVWLVVLMILFVGCKSDNLPKTVPAEGVVTLDGATVADATVIFIAEQGTYNATAVTDKDGRFQMKAFDTKSGAVPGSYKVEISKTIMESGPETGETEVNLKFGLPKKYSVFTTSGLTQTIGEQGTKEIKFELKSK